MRLEDLAIITNTSLINDRVLFEKFKHHDRVSYDPKTDLFAYKVSRIGATQLALTISSTISMFDRNLNFLQRYNAKRSRAMGCLSVRLRNLGKKRLQPSRNSKRTVKCM